MRFYIISLLVALFAIVNAQSMEEETNVLIKRAISTPYASPAILMDGTLFWIGLAVTCALWSTGKFIDIKLQRQEKYAESVAQSI
ncbi:hypothetical protein G6F56_013857 [Rhizopus delemar]|nr:hypothetical protein G6F56_013857 [Rhizopus delemar]